MPQDNAVVIISDTHLGMKNGASDLLCEFLRNTKCDKLILNGDIVDGWGINRRRQQNFPEAQARVFDAINRKIAEGTEVIYLPGNHDARLRAMKLFGKTVMGIRFEKKLEMIDPKGRKLLILHGDQLGPMAGVAQGLPPFLSHLIYDYSYSAMAWVNAAIDRIAHKTLRHHFGLMSRARRMIENFKGDKEARENKAIVYAREQGYDGIICGHFHAEENRTTKDGILYMNSGDWVENFTALAMDRQGNWRVIKWGEERHEIGLKRAFRQAAGVNPDKAFRPATEKMFDAIRSIWPGRDHLPTPPKP